MRRQGFTLLELLIVLAVLGILASLFFSNLTRSLRAAEVREAATQVAVEFRRARSAAQRSSTDVTLTAPGTAGGTTYTVGSRTVPLANRATLICKAGCGSGATVTTTYQAPYGELGATGSVFTVKSPVNGIDAYEVRLVGVTGKVSLTRATP